jgi:hypothetical protein
MNKKANTVLFILGATLFNIVVTVLSFLLLLVIYAKFSRFLPQGVQNWFFPLIFIAALAIAFVAYRYTLRFLLKKIQVEKYFDPIIGYKRKPPA